jgi:hypothetical protein
MFCCASLWHPQFASHIYTWKLWPKNRDIRKFTLFTLSLGLLSPPNSSFSGICKVRKFSKGILLNLSMKCWNSLSTKCWISAFNAQGSRGTIVLAVHVGAVKIYVAAVELLWKKWFSEFHPPPWMLMYFFAGF